METEGRLATLAGLPTTSGRPSSVGRSNVTQPPWPRFHHENLGARVSTHWTDQHNVVETHYPMAIAARSSRRSPLQPRQSEYRRSRSKAWSIVCAPCVPYGDANIPS